MINSPLSKTAPRLACTFALALLLGTTAARAGEIHVYAAASLTDAVGELADDYSRAHPGVEVKPVFASSSTLAKQIDAGAPASIFISADRKWMDYLVQRKRVAADVPHDLLGNALVMIAPKGESFALRFDTGFKPADAFQGRLCMGDPEVVPAGIYGKEALTHLGWWPALQDRVVGADDVRAALAFVERGECAAGIVYSSDAQISDKVEIVGRFPEDSHTPIIYPAALLDGESGDARDFLRYLRTPTARAVFAHYGFTLLDR
ncbi:molybdate ABC transporter substrate-binding protein [Solimonas terrae]|uniref:Molybdate ABC transporter substrate-binding protein n=1 Tax=Solimonas terrae TaxID=1396819 RepID=A0A6M2BMB2_9GAMM|nr:molybdate ABC transporter substrate-binding protein [Solimonas terrae]NGY03391.1 molybdate ABC transporter substrate-binding protein [Solimonas terrae]